MRNFAHLLRDAASRFSSRSALEFGGAAVSFAELGGRAGAIAEELVASGLHAGDRCVIYARRADDVAAAFFGILASGGTGVILSDLARPRQIEHVARNARAAWILTTAADLADLPREMRTVMRVIDLSAGRQTVRPLAPVDREPNDIAQLTYTSGSTGTPKGVMVSNANLWAGVRIVSGYLGISGDDRIAGALPLSFVYGFNQLANALYTGATLVVERSSMAQDMVASLRDRRVTVLAAVPPLWQQLLANGAFREGAISSLRLLTNAGGRLPPASVRELRAAYPRAELVLMYGFSEVFRSTWLPPQEVDAHPDSIGRAVPEARVYVAREDGSLASDDEVGELVHGGPTVAHGYFDDVVGSARVFRDNRFEPNDPDAPQRVAWSGDLVRRDASGLLYYVGRRDRMFKSLGFRVSPDEVCDALMASGEVADAAVVTQADDRRGVRIVGCVVLTEGGDVQRLRRYCGVELPRYMQPTRFEVLPALPRNASGKHDLPALEALVAAPRAQV